jgi:hypothetical protein
LKWSAGKKKVTAVFEDVGEEAMEPISRNISTEPV